MVRAVAVSAGTGSARGSLGDVAAAGWMLVGVLAGVGAAEEAVGAGADVAEAAVVLLLVVGVVLLDEVGWLVDEPCVGAVKGDWTTSGNAALVLSKLPGGSRSSSTSRTGREDCRGKERLRRLRERNHDPRKDGTSMAAPRRRWINTASQDEITDCRLP